MAQQSFSNKISDYFEAKKKIKAKKEGAVLKILQSSNVLGIGFGPKEEDGQLKKSMAIKFYVKKKLKGIHLKEIPKEEQISQEKFKDFRVDVVEMAPLFAYSPLTQRFSLPIPGGVSGATYVDGIKFTGTLGMAVRGFGDQASKSFVLSNNHVLAKINEGNIGDPILHPGTLDGGDPDHDVIGELYEYVPLRFGDPNGDIANQPVNKVDAALGLIEFGKISREIFWIGYPTGWLHKQTLIDEITKSDFHFRVQKTGRTTGYTQGYISDYGFDGWVDYRGNHAYFENQLLIKPGEFSNPGDSGSVILDMQERIVGLLFAGGATHTIANTIHDVWMNLSNLDFSDFPQ